MNLFDKIVNEALSNQPRLSTLRVVVEKELLHHDILRILSHAGLLNELTFIGGTALRSCYGGVRLSEDLDFTGGHAFSRDNLSSLSHLLIQNLNEKYGLTVVVSEPIKDINNVDTWKIKIQTRPKEHHLPAQRINIDICTVPSYDPKPMMLMNPYLVDMGTSGLIIQTQSQSEIYVDKLLAFAYRPNRIKYRDIWDMVWLHQKGIVPHLDWVALKLTDRQLNRNDFISRFNDRLKALHDEAIENAFKKEMLRFLPLQIINETIEQKNYWSFVINLITMLSETLLNIK